MNIVTFNIRKEFSKDGKYRFSNRKDSIARAIRKHEPDIIGFQEVLPEVQKWLKEELLDYYVLGCGRDKHLADESAALAIKKNRFDVIEMKTFWLSPKPYKPGTRFFLQSPCPRTCTEVLLYDIETGDVLRVYNTHLDHVGAKARLNGMKQIIKEIENERLFSDAPIFVMGDFNAWPNAPEVEILKKKCNLQDLTISIPFTFHDFGKSKTPTKIDYIFASPEVSLIESGCWEEEEYLSDHYPVYAKVNIR